MKERVFALDRLLGEILESPRFSNFKITGLRSEYMSRIPRESSPSATQVRRYLYKQVVRLIRLGWVERDGKPMSRNVQYRVLELPKGITLDLTEPPFERESQTELGSDKFCTNRDSRASAASYLHDIQAKLKSVRMDFISSLGEAETYKSILAEHPFLSEKLEATYHASRDQSLNLMGQLRALEHTVKILEEQL
ncbi:MAG: hypothetical protein KKD00_06060 [Gammaproteobacteria bacterium]|jgi:hypothetical protein|nr:hypothetical protein [Gammaproteobacteria bacterium]